MSEDENEQLTLDAAFGKRLKESAIKRGITNPNDLCERIQQAGFGLQISSVKRHWYGHDVPNGRNLLAYGRVLGISTDYLLTGTEPPLPDIDDLLETIRKVAARAQEALPDLDDETRELFRLVMKLERNENIKILLNMTRSMLLAEKEAERQKDE